MSITTTPGAFIFLVLCVIGYILMWVVHISAHVRKNEKLEKLASDMKAHSDNAATAKKNADALHEQITQLKVKTEQNQNRYISLSETIAHHSHAPTVTTKTATKSRSPRADKSKTPNARRVSRRDR